MPYFHRFSVLILPVFAATLAISALLLFNVQPMIGKMLLPHVGGSPHVWNVAMAFFQMSLLAGYGLAWLLGRLRPLWHAAGYVALLLAAMLFLPLHLPAGWQPQEGGAIELSVLSVLTLAVFVPFMTLSLSAPTLQRLFSHTRHPRAHDPYFLYAASNLGSFAGLLAYPLLFEPFLPLARQTTLWFGLYALLLGLVLLCLLLAGRLALHPATPQNQPEEAPPISAKRRLFWILLAFGPSSLCLGVTSYITMDVAATPLLWVITLGLYLLSFVLAFSKAGERITTLGLKVTPWLAVMALMALLQPAASPLVTIACALLAFFSIALTAHGLLARHRPQANHLTEFYLWLSVGGALGGSFNAFVAPVVFNSLSEYPLIILLMLMVFRQVSGQQRQPLPVLVVLAAVTLLLSLFPYAPFIQAAAFGLLTISLVYHSPLGPRPLAVSGTLLSVLIVLIPHLEPDTLRLRDFFGIVTVKTVEDSQTGTRYRLLLHGTTTHGVQIIGPEKRIEPTGYYAIGNPLASAWQTLAPSSVALIGLGSGALNCLARPQDKVRFIEIDPLIVDIARREFTFLTDCPPPEVITGDGRLELAKDNQTYDLIVLDAFSSDSIPVHIVTREAFALYLAHLNPGGAIVIHITNRFFDLEPVIAAIAHELNLSARTGDSRTLELTATRVKYPSTAMVLAPDSATLKPFDSQTDLWRPARMGAGVSGWTDDFSNTLSAIRLSLRRPVTLQDEHAPN